jgi:Nucleotidyltransferase domain
MTWGQPHIVEGRRPPCGSRAGERPDRGGMGHAAGVIGDDELVGLARRLTAVGGVVGVLLGASRARGTHTPGSDVDLGVYYRPPLDVAGLGALAREVAGPQAAVTRPGEWGPWVDGGAWLHIAGTPVDWIYRDVDRVRTSWAGACSGHFALHAQVGHPLGWPDFAYAGEIALGVVLADPSGQLTGLHDAARRYPPALAATVVTKTLWEASFSLEIAGKAVSREDTTYVAGCVFRAVGLCAHGIHARAGRWLINEKGAVAAAGRLPTAPPGFAHRSAAVLGDLGTTATQLSSALDRARALVADTAASCTGVPPPAAR